MPHLDAYGPFVYSAFVVTWLVLGAYLLYLRSRIAGARRRQQRLRELKRAATSTQSPSGAPVRGPASI